MLELAELVYGACTPATAWAAWRLVDEGLYFQGTPETINVRPLAEVEQERIVREAKTAERDAWNGFLQRARAGCCAPEDARYLLEVEELIWGQREQSRVLQALECNQTPESAHALLLRLGYWNERHNPWPRRTGAILEQPTVPLAELPQEPRLDLTGLPAFAIDIRGGHGQPRPAQRQCGDGQIQHSMIHSMAPFTISALISSNSPLARWM